MDVKMKNSNNDLTSGVSDTSGGNAGNDPATTPVTSPVTGQPTEVDEEKKSIKIDENFKADVDTSTATIEDREEDSESYMDDTGDY